MSMRDDALGGLPADRATSPQATLPSVEDMGVSQCIHLDAIGSTMDVAHDLATNGAPAGTLVLADRQRSGRGRNGRRWESMPGAGIWMTLVERPRESHGIGVLALRLGMAIADAVTPFVDAPVLVKWPNDVYVGDGKLAGILVEARWRDATLDWVAIGVGINLEVPPDVANATALRRGTSRNDVLRALVPRMRTAAAAHGVLATHELAAWRARDLAEGRLICEPRIGRVEGIRNDGALLIRTADSTTAEAVYAGSMVFDSETAQ